MKTVICWLLEKAWRAAKRLGLVLLCVYFWEGECWNRYIGVMGQSRWVVSVSGGLELQSSRKREEELYEKARVILMDSPDGAPLGEVWLVYIQLRDRLDKGPDLVKRLRARRW